LGKNWNNAWEKLLSVLLTANIAMMGWLWANVARLADRIDKHVEERAIHEPFDRREFVGRREFEARSDGAAAAERGLAARVEKLEEKVERAVEGRKKDGA